MNNKVYPPQKLYQQLNCNSLMSPLFKYTIIFLVLIFSKSQIFSQCPYNDEWPPAIVEMHYNNTGPDINEYIEVHQYSLGCQLPNPYNWFDEIKFYDNLGVLYKTLPISSMQVYFVSGGSGHAFYYYQFPSNESFADNGTVRLLNNFSGVLNLADYVYNSTGITENRYYFFPPISARTFPTFEDETTPVGSSLNFCGYYKSPIWNAYIMASSYGTYNACTILPVNLSSFNYTLINNAVRLNWQTSSEFNNDRFEVERSTDGTNFNKIGNVASAGISNTVKDYSFPDNNPAAINYYRIKQIDKDGKAVYSKTLTVKFKGANPLTIQPTIVTDQLSVKIGLQQQEINTVQVYDISGKAILNFTGRSGYNEINVSHFSAGSYFIRLQTSDGKTYSQQFVKK